MQVQGLLLGAEPNNKWESTQRNGFISGGRSKAETHTQNKRLQASP